MQEAVRQGWEVLAPSWVSCLEIINATWWCLDQNHQEKSKKVNPLVLSEHSHLLWLKLFHLIFCHFIFLYFCTYCKTTVKHLNILHLNLQLSYDSLMLNLTWYVAWANVRGRLKDHPQSVVSWWPLWSPWNTLLGEKKELFNLTWLYACKKYEAPLLLIESQQIMFRTILINEQAKTIVIKPLVVVSLPALGFPLVVIISDCSSWCISTHCTDTRV